MPAPASHPLLDELQWRGLLYQQTEGLVPALHHGVVTGYAGFDPSAPSLHVGNLIPVMALVHLQRSGHRPIALVGGGTGLIGDPSGRPSERQLLSSEQVEANARGIGAQLERFLEFVRSGTGARLVNNGEWLGQLHAIEFMRDVGKHFTVNYMMQKESVKARLDAGISYTEFSYMLLQAYDYLELFRRHNVTLQLGGSDQWGNITAGIELIRRSAGAEANALTLPLVTTASGAKFGKSEAGAVWLDPVQTSPYKFYQFWLHTDDRDVSRYLRYFTLLPHAEIESLDHATAEHPEDRVAQHSLARDMTCRVHGAEALGATEEVSGFLFGRLDPRGLSAAALELLRAEIPFVEVNESQMTSDGGYDVIKLLTAVGLAASNGAARRLLDQGGVSVNKRKLEGQERVLRQDEVLLPGRYIILGKGKREYGLLRVR